MDNEQELATEQDVAAAEPLPTSPTIDKTSVAYLIATIDQALDVDKFKKAVDEHFSALAIKHAVSDYTILYLLDAQDSLSSWHSNQIYKAASSAKKARDILLVVHSLGGSIEAGYFIGKTGKRLAKSKFAVSVPRKAKSAATLLSLGADEIHMGLLSELGPIDPQVNGFPAQGIKNALEILSEMSSRHPSAAGMLGEYLVKKLDLRILGLFERINESAIQYAERLIADKPLPNSRTAKSLSDHLVNHYKDHGFVIDYDEAAELLGSQIIKQDTKEYAFANDVFESFDLAKFFLEFMAGKDIDIVGSSSNGIRVFDKRDEA